MKQGLKTRNLTEVEEEREDEDSGQNKTFGRWTKEEHKKFVQGNRYFHIFISLAMKLYGKDWKKVEEYIETRSGA